MKTKPFYSSTFISALPCFDVIVFLWYEGNTIPIVFTSSTLEVIY